MTALRSIEGFSSRKRMREFTSPVPIRKCPMRPGRSLARADAPIDGHIEALGFEVAVVERHGERRCVPVWVKKDGPSKLIEREFHGCLRGARAGTGKNSHGPCYPRNPATVDEMDHVCSPLHPDMPLLAYKSRVLHDE